MLALNGKAIIIQVKNVILIITIHPKHLFEANKNKILPFAPHATLVKHIISMYYVV